MIAMITVVGQVTELIEESCLAGSRGENKVFIVITMVIVIAILIIIVIAIVINIIIILIIINVNNIIQIFIIFDNNFVLIV